MKKEVKIGLAILAGVVLLYLSLTWIKNIHLFAVDRTMYTMRFSDVSGLKEGDPVTVFGYASGNVASIGIDGQGALVKVSLSEDVAVQTDATAMLKVKEIMGGKVIELIPGKSGRKMPNDQPIPGTTSLDFQAHSPKRASFWTNSSRVTSIPSWAT